MTRVQPVSAAWVGFSRPRLRLEMAFKWGADEALAQRFLEAEAGDFVSDARGSELWLGAYENTEKEDFEVNPSAIMRRLSGR